MKSNSTFQQQSTSASPFKIRVQKRPKTKGNKNCLTTLQNLDDLKKNPNLHTLSYEQLNNTLLTHKSVIMSTKGNLIRVQSTKARVNTEDYISLDPAALRDKVPKKQRKLCIPSEKRQLLMGKYTNYTESSPKSELLQTFDSVWHQTLSVKSAVASRDQDKNRLLTSTTRFSPMMTYESSTMRKDTVETSNFSVRNRNNIQFGRSKDTLDDDDAADSAFLVSREVYNNVSRELKDFESLLKDFYKMVSHTEKSYWKAQTQQSELHHFVTVFVKEITELEKISKEPKLQQLEFCLANIKHKIREIEGHQELIHEQIGQIKKFLDAPATESGRNLELSFGGGNDHEPGNIHNPRITSTSPLTVYSVEGGVQPVSAILAKSSATAKPSKFGLILDLVDQDREDDKRPTSPELFGKIRSKTNQIKVEVKQLQSERMRFIINLKEERTSSVMSRSSKPRAGLKNWPTNSEFERTEESLESSNFTFKNDQGLLKSHILYDLNQSNEGLSNSERPQSKTPAILLQDLNNQEYVQPEEKEEEEAQIGRAWDSAVEYYEMFVETLQSLEKALSERIKSIKVLDKDLESPWSKEERNGTLPREIEKCFSNAMESVQGYQQYFIEQRTKFLKEVFRHFNALSSLSRSNLLKLDSLKNLIESSIKKLLQAENYSKKYTYYDLEDKKLREKYEKHYEKLKAELSTMHKTLTFLSEQFGVSISLYKLNPIAKPSKEEIENSKVRIETILKGVSYLRNIPPLDDEYNEKTTKAYQLIKELYQKNQVLTKISSENQFTAVESVCDANQSLAKVKRMSISIQGLKNNLEVMSKNGILQILIEKPLVTTIKLSKKLEMSEKELKQSIRRVQDDISGQYEKLIELCEQIESQVELHTKRILNNKEHLVFSEWKQIFQIFVSIKEDIEGTEGKIEKFMDQDLFVIGTSLPKPAEKAEKMQSLKNRVEAVMKTLATADMLNSETLLAHFADLRTSNLREKLQGLSQTIEEEISNKEKLRDELDAESVLVKRIVEEVIQFLRRLKSILNKAFELDDKVAKEYEEFNAQFLEATQQSNNSFVIGESAEEFQPKLFIVSSLFENSSPKVTLSLSPSNMKKQQSHLRKQSSRTVAKMMMSAPEQSEHQCSEQVSYFIGRIKSLFKELIDDQAVLYQKEHVIFFEIFNRFQSMSKTELETLGKVQHAIEGVQKHYTYYDKMIRPLATLFKCIDLLPQWEETSNELTMMKWKMLTTYQTIRHFEGDRNVRGGVETQLIRYRQIQEILISSVDIVSEIFSNAEILNEKKFKPYLGNHIRVEEGSITEFINQIEKVSEKVMRTFRSSPTGIERDTMDLSKKFLDYVKDLVKLLKFTQNGYGEIFRIISEGVKPHEEDLIKYLEAIYNSMKNLTDVYCDGVNELAATAGKPVWIVKSLDEFYREVILKDLKTFANLWEISKEIEEYLIDFRENFVELEIKQKAQYRRIADSNPTKCDLRLARVTELAQNLNFLMFSEELMYRANLKQILMSKHKYLLNVKKICSHFAMIYSMGRKVYDRVVQTLNQKDTAVVSQELFLIERMLQDMILRLEKASVESKTLGGGSSSDLNMDLNIKKVIKHDILSFYIDIEAWIRQLKVNLSRIVNFQIDLKRNFKGLVLLLRDDWISFIREWFANTYLGVDDNLKQISDNYQDFRDKIEGLLKEVKKPALADVNIVKGVVDSVQYLNEHFFQEWFFNAVSEEKHHFMDKLSPEIAKFSDLVKSRKYNYEKLLKKCKKLHHRIEKCDKVMKFLNTKQNVTPIFENGIKAWETVQDYYRVKNFKGWLDLLVFVQNRILISPDNESKKMNFKEIVQSLDGLYLATEREIKCELTKSQKDFLSICYDWIQTQVFGEVGVAV